MAWHDLPAGTGHPNRIAHETEKTGKLAAGYCREAPIKRRLRIVWTLTIALGIGGAGWAAMSPEAQPQLTGFVRLRWRIFYLLVRRPQND